MDVLQIDPVTFLIQVAGLGAWICVGGTRVFDHREGAWRAGGA